LFLGVVHGGARIKAVAARHRLRGFGQGEGDAHFLAVVAPDLEPVRAPPRIGEVDCDPAIVPAFLTVTGMGSSSRPYSVMMR
jgi:hypothetical protein